MNKDKLIRNSIIGIFVTLYIITSIVSTIHVIDFFELTNPKWLAISLAIAFEIGSMACLAAIIILDKTSRSLVWFLFILLTLMQMMGNTYYAYDNAKNFDTWMELFILNEEEIIYQKRILAVISGAILPLVSLGFIKSLVDYVKPNKANIKMNKELNSVESESKSEKQFLSDVNAIQSKNIDNNNYLDEETIFNDADSVSSNQVEQIQAIKNETNSNIINEIENLSNYTNQKHINNINKKTHIIEEPGNGSIIKKIV